jgi:hypothetical protein
MIFLKGVQDLEPVFFQDVLLLVSLVVPCLKSEKLGAGQKLC